MVCFRQSLPRSAYGRKHGDDCPFARLLIAKVVVNAVPSSGNRCRCRGLWSLRYLQTPPGSTAR